MTPSNIKLDVSNPNCEYFDGYRINFALCYFFILSEKIKIETKFIKCTLYVKSYIFFLKFLHMVVFGQLNGFTQKCSF
jgi:hypothetical protein